MQTVSYAITIQFATADQVTLVTLNSDASSLAANQMTNARMTNNVSAMNVSTHAL